MFAEAFDAFLAPWGDESLWLPTVAWLLLMATALSGGLPEGGLRRLIVLAIAIQAAPVAGLLIFRAFGNRPMAYEVPVALAILQSLNIATLIAGMAGALPFTRARAARASQAASPPPENIVDAAASASAATAERRRIAGDLHDGLATRLVMLLASLPSQGPPYADIARGLQDCLLELQMTVDGLGTEHASLGAMLADLRYRVEPAFQRAGMQLLWDVPELVPHVEIEGDDRIHREVCKIAQEALSNALRHSGARRVQVSLKDGGGHTPSTLQVSDDGHGFRKLEPGSTPRRHGQGLRNMHARAQAIHAGISITNLAPHGLRVSVTLPRTGRPRRLVPH